MGISAGRKEKRSCTQSVTTETGVLFDLLLVLVVVVDADLDGDGDVDLAGAPLTHGPSDRREC